VFADEILHPRSGLVPLPTGDTPLYEVFKKLEAPPDFFAHIKERAEKCGLLFLATPFGPASAACLKRLSPAFVKIASPELNYTQLLTQVATWQVPILLSSGVSTLSDIEAALAILRKPAVKVGLLHCVTSYPAPETDYNLNVISNLRNIFGIPVGVSDHSLDPVLVPTLSLSCGAFAIEKHFCLSRTDCGLDDPIALPPSDFAKMTRALREAAVKSPSDVIDGLKREYGAKEVEAVLGDGVKRLAKSEAANYGLTNRSLHAMRDIDEGEVIGNNDIGVLRTEKILRPGLPPSWLEKIIGRRARVFITAGEGLRFEDV
jgi:sialic acid synthase SpsE